MRTLLVEDDQHLRAAVCDVLRLHGVVVRLAGSAADAMTQLSDDVDIVVLDLGLPDQDGLTLLSQIRSEQACLPILIATARGDLRSRLHGLNLGADDYIVKPYAGLELLARLHAVRRRTARPDTAAAETVRARLASGRIMLNLDTRDVRIDGRPIALTRTEFDIFELLATAPGVVLRKEHIISRVWASAHSGMTHTLEVHVASLRSKLGREVIQTVRGIGYRLAGEQRPGA